MFYRVKLKDGRVKRMIPRIYAYAMQNNPRILDITKEDPSRMLDISPEFVTMVIDV